MRTLPLVDHNAQREKLNSVIKSETSRSCNVNSISIPKTKTFLEVP